MKLTWPKSNFQKMVLLELFFKMGIVELPNSVRSNAFGMGRYVLQQKFLASVLPYFQSYFMANVHATFILKRVTV